MQFNGVLENARVGLIPQIRSVTFAFYRDQRGGSPLWQETQNVTVDSQGRFAVTLGAATRDGLPLDLFAKGDPRWLGFQVNGAEAEQARVLLGSVPYALKAIDADTFGGKPLSAFVLTTGPSVDNDVPPAKNVNCTNLVHRDNPGGCHATPSSCRRALPNSGEPVLPPRNRGNLPTRQNTGQGKSPARRRTWPINDLAAKNLPRQRPAQRQAAKVGHRSRQDGWDRQLPLRPKTLRLGCAGVPLQLTPPSVRRKKHRKNANAAHERIN
jgi:hypothetical protein